MSYVVTWPGKSFPVWRISCPVRTGLWRVCQATRRFPPGTCPTGSSSRAIHRRSWHWPCTCLHLRWWRRNLRSGTPGTLKESPFAAHLGQQMKKKIWVLDPVKPKPSLHKNTIKKFEALSTPVQPSDGICPAQSTFSPKAWRNCD